MAYSLTHKESIISRCWPRSRSPVGSGVIFFQHRVSTSPSHGTMLLKGSPIFLYLRVTYRNSYNTFYADSQFAIEWHVESVVKPASLNIYHTSTLPSLPTIRPPYSMDIDKLFKACGSPTRLVKLLNCMGRFPNCRLVATNVGCRTRLLRT